MKQKKEILLLAGLLGVSTLALQAEKQTALSQQEDQHFLLPDGPGENQN